MRILTAVAAAASLACALPAMAQTTNSATKMSQSECAAAWTKLDVSKSGSVTESQAHGAVLIPDFKAADSNHDGKLTQTEFMSACAKGMVTASAGTGSGSRGMTGSEKK